MGTRLLTFLRSVSSYVWFILLAAYFSIIAGQSVYRNYDSQQQTTALEAQLQTAEQQKARLEALIVYYNTDNYKEKALRQELLLKMPNETVYALPESSSNDDTLLNDPADATTTQAAAPTQDSRQNAPYWQQWLTYLLHGSNKS